MARGRVSRVLVRLSLVVALVAGLVVTTGAPALAADGDLDPTFGTDGLIVADFGMADNPGWAMTIDALDRVLVAGAASNGTNQDAYVARYTPDGVLDPTFGEGGVAMVNFGPQNDRSFDSSMALAIALDAEGRIVIGGHVLGTARTDQGFPLARLTPDGALDRSFGKGGRVITPVAGTIQDLVITPEGAIVAVGTTGSDILVARYTAKGGLDRGFGRKGILVQDWGASQEYATGVAVDGLGRVVVAGFGVLSTSPIKFGLSVARYTPKGAPDKAFGAKGRATLELADGARAQDLLLVEGRIVVVGSADNPGGTPDDFLLAAYTDAGTLDPSFATEGITTTSVGPATFDGIEGAATDGAGGIVVAGFSGEAGKDRAVVARYTHDGQLDPTFGGGAPVITELPGNAYYTGVGVQAGDRFVAAGRTRAATASTQRLASIALAQAQPRDVVVTGGYQATTPVAAFLDAIDRDLTEAVAALGRGETFPVSHRLHGAAQVKHEFMRLKLGTLCGLPFVEWYKRFDRMQGRLGYTLRLLGQEGSPLPLVEFEDIQRGVVGIGRTLDEAGCLTPGARDALVKATEALSKAQALVTGPATRQAEALQEAQEALVALCQSDALLRDGLAFCTLYGQLYVLDEAIYEAQLAFDRRRPDELRAAVERALALNAELRSMLAGTAGVGGPARS